ncbi:hypothetical protein FJQ34_01585 [Escherichia coli]|nr:hypothetical protein [Escherichia coli]
MECDLLMIKIEKVINKNDLKAFIAFPSSLYPDDPNWIPPLFIERNEHLSAKNPGTVFKSGRYSNTLSTGIVLMITTSLSK